MAPRWAKIRGGWWYVYVCAIAPETNGPMSPKTCTHYFALIYEEMLTPSSA